MASNIERTLLEMLEMRSASSLSQCNFNLKLEVSHFDCFKGLLVSIVSTL